MSVEVEMKSVNISEWNEMRQELQSLRAEKLSYDSIASSLTTELDSINKRLKEKELNCQKYSELITNLRKTNCSINEKYQNLLTEKDELLSNLNQLKNKLNNLENEKTNFNKQNYRVQDECDRLTEEVK